MLICFVLSYFPLKMPYTFIFTFWNCYIFLKDHWGSFDFHKSFLNHNFIYSIFSYSLSLIVSILLGVLSDFNTLVLLPNYFNLDIFTDYHLNVFRIFTVVFQCIKFLFALPFVLLYFKCFTLFHDLFYCSFYSIFVF